MRVIHVSPYFAPAFGFGGPPRSILALCRAQQAAGLDVEVFTTTANGAGGLPEATDGTTYDDVPVRYFPLRGWPSMFWAPELGVALARAASEADVIHTHGLFNAPAWQAHRTARLAHRPLVVSVRGMLEPSARAHHKWRKRGAWALFDRRVCEGAALLHTTSALETTSLRAFAPDAHIVEIPNAIEARRERVLESDRRAMRARLNIGADTAFVLFLGRLHPIKRLDLLARAFAQVAGTNREARLVIAGDGDARVRATAESELGDARSRAIWLGQVDGRERDALLSEAAALVLCSDSENFGMSVAEALACGVVPVVTNTCPWEMVAQASAGFWVPQTAAALAGALEHVLAHPEAARTMGERGRRLAAERFAPGVVGAAWASAYAQLEPRVSP